MEITIAVVSPLAHIFYNVTLMRTTEFSYRIVALTAVRATI